MGMTQKSIAQQLAEAEASAGRSNFAHGKGVLVLKRLIEKTGFKGQSLIAEFSVLSSEPMKPGFSPNPAGSSVSFVQNLKLAGAINRFKAFFLALICVPENAISGADLIEAYDEAFNNDPAKGPVQPMAGQLVGFDTYDTTSGKGVAIVAVNFQSIPNQTDETRAANRKNLGL